MQSIALLNVKTYYMHYLVVILKAAMQAKRYPLLQIEE